MLATRIKDCPYVDNVHRNQVTLLTHLEIDMAMIVPNKKISITLKISMYVPAKDGDKG